MPKPVLIAFDCHWAFKLFEILYVKIIPEYVTVYIYISKSYYVHLCEHPASYDFANT